MKNKEFDLNMFLRRGLERLLQKYPPYYKTKIKQRVPVIVELILKNIAKVFIPSENRHIEVKICKEIRLGARVMFRCEECGRLFFAKQYLKNQKTGRYKQYSMFAVDHISPKVDPEKGFQDWNTFIERTFCNSNNFQLLCNYPGEIDGQRSCHKIKSSEEMKVRHDRNFKKKKEIKTNHKRHRSCNNKSGRTI